MTKHFDVHCDFIKTAGANVIRYVLSFLLAMFGVLISGMIWYGVWYVMDAIYSKPPIDVIEIVFCSIGGIGSAIMAIIAVMDAYDD